ncbi:FIST C-terminal domain-containing protein [Actinocrinis puniceicyclus]|uniref:FIST C-terminal domain-containing protein n=1 Tax=Actinocrinis puniceicyclus TaxID=977794 RepID=A0A8J7WR51_9ACTN|nr:FIST N-terminal domain-containing protein [Actinocrinis puniceicyclus]MBS2964917.1 FIST C-terminal domain-containing protein [Actinocrinis puniceicyclus]
MSRFGEGLAVDTDVERAARRAAYGALSTVDGPPDLVAVFAGVTDPDDADRVAASVQAMVAATGNERCTVVGALTPGVMGDARAVGPLLGGDPAVSVWAGRLPGVRVRSFHLHANRQGESITVGGLPEPWPDDRVVLMLADPHSFPADGFIERSNEALPGLPFVGGLVPGVAGRGSARLIRGGSTHDEGAVGVMLGGPVDAAIAVSQGCRPIGPTMTVTAAEGNMLLGLAGRPALDRLREILDELDAAERLAVSTGLHLGVAMDEYADQHESGDFLIRGVLGTDPERGGIAVGDVIGVGRTVRFQLRDAASAGRELDAVLEACRGRPGYATIGGALVVSCNGRAADLFPQPLGAGHDILAVRAGLGTNAVSGFFGAGEIGPVGGRNHLHGYTASVLAFAEPDARIV